MARYVCNVSFGVSAVCVFAERPDSGARKCETLLRRFVAGGGATVFMEGVRVSYRGCRAASPIFSLVSPEEPLEGLCLLQHERLCIERGKSFQEMVR